jgi:hypothetical protein
VVASYPLPNYATLNHSDGTVGWINQIAVAAAGGGDKRQKKRRIWVFSALSGGWYEKKGTVGFFIVSAYPCKANPGIHFSSAACLGISLILT